MGAEELGEKSKGPPFSDGLSLLFKKMFRPFSQKFGTLPISLVKGFDKLKKKLTFENFQKKKKMSPFGRGAAPFLQKKILKDLGKIRKFW